jgi:hypothetical protein
MGELGNLVASQWPEAGASRGFPQMGARAGPIISFMRIVLDLPDATFSPREEGEPARWK